MLISWDIGKRCNLDCTYCPASRHTNNSPHATLDNLITTFEFAKKWATLYNSHRKNPSDAIEMNFTGGEPTNNPNFWKLIEHIKQDSGTYWLGLTTNGTWGKKQAKLIIENIGAATVSYHCEAGEIIRKSVLENILELTKNGVHVQVNVMLHTDLWEVAMEACEFLDTHGVFYNPVPIGDGPHDHKGWVMDVDGKLRRPAHEYSLEQQEWFFKKMNITYDVLQAKIGNKLGRACCGGRKLCGKVDDIWQDVKLVNTEFKDWYCMVDWFFLHIDQELGQVFHHQTCQATRGARGPIGTLNNTDELLANLELLLSNDAVEPIVCPNARCGCGMCVPKAQNKEDIIQIWRSITDVPIREI